MNIQFDGLIRQGVVRNYADLARLGGVPRAQITLNLLNLLAAAEYCLEVQPTLFSRSFEPSRPPINRKQKQ